MIKINLVNIRFWLFWALVILIPLSKYPSFALPAYNFTSFRIGLYQILAVLFVLLCAWGAIKKIPALFRQNKLAFSSLVVLALVVLIGLFTALDKSRSLLLAVSIWFLLALVATAWWYVKYELLPTKYALLLKSILYAGIIYGILGLMQFVIGSFSTSSLGIACGGCSSDIFGFPRVNLFSAEPLFFANALLPFFFVAFALFYKSKTKLALFALIFTSLAIALTFSRGAYGAVAVGLLVFAILAVAVKSLNLKRYLVGLGVIIICSLVGWGLMIASASWQYRSTSNITFDTANTILQHVSLGLVSLPQQNSVQTSAIPDEQPVPCATLEESSEFESPGLIQASTSDRLGAADLALQAWASNLKTASIGVGAGNLGPYVVNNVDESAPYNLTVYIYYILILAELGVIGLLCFLLIYASGFYNLYKNRLNNPLLFVTASALLVAFLVQYGFFGTYINTIYVWLFAGIVLGLKLSDTNNK